MFSLLSCCSTRQIPESGRFQVVVPYLPVMTHLDLDSASLLRLLTAFFGEDRVIYGMSLYAVCGGDLSDVVPLEQVLMAKGRMCLFTVVDESDYPKLVVDLLPCEGGVVEMGRYEEQDLVENALFRAGIKYAAISENELRELQDARSGLDLCTLLTAKVGSD